MQATGRTTGRGGVGPNRANAAPNGNRAISNATATGVTLRSKLTAPLSTHTTGTRKTVHGGGGDGGSVDGAGSAWKQTGRRLGGNSSAGAGGKGNAIHRLAQPTIASSLRATNNRQQRGTHPNAQLERTIAGGKSNENVPAKPPKRRVMSAAAKQAARERLWPSRPAGGSTHTSNLRKEKLAVAEEPKSLDDYEAMLREGEGEDNEEPAQEMLEMGVQTNEAEILDHELLTGSVKMVTPSRRLLEQIERERRETKAKIDRQSVRRFAPHEQDEELHLDELKEYSERNAVTKRAPKKPPPITYSTYDNQYQNVFKSMDDFFSREIPKSESVTNIQERIRRKEQELMSLFDDVDLNE
ncbi:uncharacterized protein Dana_GF11150 [Drosophila ananassae]|uniref:Uncharacterized protein n=1 Tax=Drosophila ananassae TaxID=7217 RepID=B3MHG8_DROAN|nr:uncharacterized protein LOC6494014 [Drosophila ananassae]EDV37968.1 uncharacterized protein Dana_GF11150 [Drosophila ananassae]